MDFSCMFMHVAERLAVSCRVLRQSKQSEAEGEEEADEEEEEEGCSFI